MAAARVLTTGRLAKLLGVCPKTVANWIDRGELEAYRLSPQHDRRIEIEVALAFVRSKPRWPIRELEEYARKCGVPVFTCPTVLVYSPTASLVQYFAAAHFQAIPATRPLLCGRLLSGRDYEVIIVDQAMGSQEADEILDLMARERPQTRTVLVANEDDERGEQGWNAHHYYPRSVGMDRVARELFGRLRAGVPLRKAG